MQVSRPIILYLPGVCARVLENRLRENPPSWRYDPVYFHYLIHYLTVRQIQRKNDKGFTLYAQKLSEVTTWKIDKYIKYLVNEDILKRDYYIKGERQYHYWLNPEYLDGFHRIEVKPGTRLHTNMIACQRLKRKNINRLPPFLKQMQRHLMGIDLNYAEARKWIESQQDEAKKYSYLTALGMIEDKRFLYFKRNNTNKRLDTNLTNLKTELLQFIKGDFVSIDLANSQPFFMSQLLKMIIQSMDLNKKVPDTLPLCSCNLDLDLIQWFGKQQFNGLSKIPQNDLVSINEELLNYENTVTSGNFYDDFLSLFSHDALTRKEVKKMMFAVLFSQNEIHEKFKRIVPYQKEKEKFVSVYPFVYHVIHALKQKDHAKLAILLQRMESGIFIDGICPALVNEGIIPLTKHDSIIVKTENKESALQVCQTVFNNHFGIIAYSCPIRTAIPADSGQRSC